jgi:hypothetical protein
MSIIQPWIKKTCKLPPRQFRTKFLQPCSTLRTPDEPINGSSENSTVNGTSEKPTVKAEPDQIYLYSKQRAARSGKREREDNRCLTGCGRRPCSWRACPRKHPGWSWDASRTCRGVAASWMPRGAPRSLGHVVQDARCSASVADNGPP